MPKKEKVLYLSFDDGPIPEVTEWVLDTLLSTRQAGSRNSATLDSPIPATFFCIGDNVRKHPKIFKKIISSNHAIGNHTYNHLKGWQTAKATYIENTQLCEKEMSKIAEKEGKKLNFPLFRPPYGKIKRNQAKALRKLGYTLIMYRIVAYDWDENTSPKQCLENIIKNTRSGDIIVFHDSVKAYKNLKYTLPRAIDYFLKNGYRFEKL